MQVLRGAGAPSLHQNVAPRLAKFSPDPIKQLEGLEFLAVQGPTRGVQRYARNALHYLHRQGFIELDGVNPSIQKMGPKSPSVIKRIESNSRKTSDKPSAALIQTVQMDLDWFVANELRKHPEYEETGFTKEDLIQEGLIYFATQFYPGCLRARSNGKSFSFESVYKHFFFKKCSGRYANNFSQQIVRQQQVDSAKTVFHQGIDSRDVDNEKFLNELFDFLLSDAVIQRLSVRKIFAFLSYHFGMVLTPEGEFVPSGDKRSLEDIGRDLGVSRGRVQQIALEVLRYIRQNFKSEFFEGNALSRKRKVISLSNQPNNDSEMLIYADVDGYVVVSCNLIPTAKTPV